jgi:Icc-related predicted phosphoesterase
MKISCISDSHGLHRKLEILEEADMLIFAGDCMNSGYSEYELTDFLNWFSLQPHKYKIMIAGNHDRWIEDSPIQFRALLKLYPSIIYLEDESVEIEGLKIYGTPHSKEFCSWAFNRNEFELEALFSKIPSDTDILISHAPELYILDTLVDGRSVGEFTLTERIRKLTNLKLHVVGHVHNSFGMLKRHNKHISINASQVDESYRVVNFPITINI